MKKIIHIVKETSFDEKDIKVEDGGAYKEIYAMNNPDEDNGMFIKICSWNNNAKHKEFDKFIGKKVKVTIETID